jgi:putative spermidine/putrescine transport system substrate-binding protein
MKTTLILTSALCSLGLAAQAQNKEVNVVSWGGAYERSQVEAYNIPFAEQTGIKVNMLAADNPATPLKAQVEAGNITGDVFDIEVSDAIRLCDEGALVEIDPAILPPAPDGTPATEDFIPGALQECAVANIFWGTVIAFDSTKFDGEKPSTAADFFDTAKFPGKRGLPKNPKRTLYLALIADGVAPDQIYEVLGTPEGVDQAFAKLDTIKNDVIWWEAGAQPPQLLADGEVSMAFAFNGRIFNAAQQEGKPFKIVWDGQIYEMEGWVMPKGAPNPEAAREFIAFSTAPEQQARAAEFISYGPPRVSAAALVGNIEGTDVPMGPNLPTYAENLENALASNLDFWVDHDAELQERFNAWLAN